VGLAGNDKPGILGAIVDRRWVNHEADARAAILAMREPTEAMQLAGNASIEEHLEYQPGGDAALLVWRSGIDAALGEEG
jgi:hypothetical protein